MLLKTVPRSNVWNELFYLRFRAHLHGVAVVRFATAAVLNDMNCPPFKKRSAVARR